MTDAYENSKQTAITEIYPEDDIDVRNNTNNYCKYRDFLSLLCMYIF